MKRGSADSVRVLSHKRRIGRSRAYRDLPSLPIASASRVQRRYSFSYPRIGSAYLAIRVGFNLAHTSRPKPKPKIKES
jgi:hypothetical protein